MSRFFDLDRFRTEPVLRKVILSATNQPLIANPVRKYGMQLGASRFVAGENFEECIPVLRRLNAQGFRTNTTLLGESVEDAETASGIVEEYRHILGRIDQEQLTCNIALKLTHLGLDFDEDVALQNVKKLVIHAGTLGNFIRIDMEDSPRVDATLRIYEHLRAEGHENIGTVLQSYLYRTPDDLDRLRPMRPNLRIVKGAYLEPEDVAYPDKNDVDRQYVEQTKQMLRTIPFTAIATHDDKIIEELIEFAEKEGIPRDRFEFQMLYGIRQQLQRELLARGFDVLIATPYGAEWYYYLMRRLAERPANVLFFAKNAIRR